MKADITTTEDLLSDESFINYCKGVSPADIAFWESYVQKNPEKAYLVEEAKEQFLELFNALAMVDLDAEAKRLESSILERDDTLVIEMEKFEMKRSRRALPFLFKISAAAVLIAGMFVTINYIVSDQKKIKTYTAVYGERKNIQLPDGSVVTLNAGSNIKINKGFGISTREVCLEGEAFFEVKHDPSRPFIVHTPAMDVKALGTAFNVKAYLNEKHTEASLISGLVEVTLKENNNRKMLLYPNQKIGWETGSLVKQGVRSKPLQSEIGLADSLAQTLTVTSTGDIKEIAWKDNKLIFDDEEFKDIAVLLERWYGTKINFKDTSIYHYRFTGTYEKEDLNTVLNFLKESRNFNYTSEQGEEVLTINISK